jgi:hypothetical protein
MEASSLQWNSWSTALICSVVHHLTTPYSQQENGLVEWQNQTVISMARSMMKVKQMLAES